MNKIEQTRLMVLNKLEKREIGLEKAAQLLGLSERHVKRLISEYNREGLGALIHGNRGRKPVHVLSDDIRQRIVELAQSKYAGFNQQHYTEKLAENEGISVSRSSIRRILSDSGIYSPHKRRYPMHRRRRDRFPQEGPLLQVDGSPHDWFEGRCPKLSLSAAIDNGTCRVPCAIFREQKDAQGYVLLLQQLVAIHSVPVALYFDQHSIFERTLSDKESMEEQPSGKRKLTQLGRIMEDLGIGSISAITPRAKGRIERLWGTFQYRLISELRMDGSITIYYQGKCLLIGPSPDEAPILRTRTGELPSMKIQSDEQPPPIKTLANKSVEQSKIKYKPALNHPWRQYAHVNICRE